MEKMKIGLELYSVRDAYDADLLATLKRVKEIGYECVEFFGDFKYSVEEIVSALKETGLEICGWHTGYHYLQENFIETTIAYNKAIGNQYIIIPALDGDLTKTAEDWKKLSADFNRISRRLEKEGMHLGYHSHTIEFQDFGGQMPWDIIFSNTDPEVIMQVDSGNILSSGKATAAQFLRKYPGRSATVHAKPYSKTREFDCFIGEDDVDWEEFLSLSKNEGKTKYMVVEYEILDDFKGVTDCYNKLKKMIG